MKLLHVDSSILGAYSVSRQLSAEIVAKLRQNTPDLEFATAISPPIPCRPCRAPISPRSNRARHRQMRRCSAISLWEERSSMSFSPPTSS